MPLSGDKQVHNPFIKPDSDKPKYQDARKPAPKFIKENYVRVVGEVV